MSRLVLRRVHITASVVALFTIVSFLTATLTAEISGDEGVVATVKFWIARAIAVLVVAMASAALSGRKLARRSRAPIVKRKLRRVQAAAAIGLLILIPCAIGLDQLASHGRFGGMFVVLQGIELAGGALNLTLLALNFRDGMTLSGRMVRGRLRRERRSIREAESA